jgi:hypothetical protein
MWGRVLKGQQFRFQYGNLPPSTLPATSPFINTQTTPSLLSIQTAPNQYGNILPNIQSTPNTHSSIFPPPINSKQQKIPSSSLQSNQIPTLTSTQSVKCTSPIPTPNFYNFEPYIINNEIGNDSAAADLDMTAGGMSDDPGMVHPGMVQLMSDDNADATGPTDDDDEGVTTMVLETGDPTLTSPGPGPTPNVVDTLPRLTPQDVDDVVNAAEHETDSDDVVCEPIGNCDFLATLVSLLKKYMHLNMPQLLFCQIEMTVILKC